MHEGHELGERNDTGERVFNFAPAYDLVILNIFFRKRNEHYIMYEIEGNKSKIDYFIWMRWSLKQCKDSKVSKVSKYW